MAKNITYELTLSGGVVTARWGNGRSQQEKDPDKVEFLTHEWGLTENQPVRVIGKQLKGRKRFDRLAEEQ